MPTFVEVSEGESKSSNLHYKCGQWDKSSTDFWLTWALSAKHDAICSVSNLRVLCKLSILPDYFGTVRKWFFMHRSWFKLIEKHSLYLYFVLISECFLQLPGLLAEHGADKTHSSHAADAVLRLRVSLFWIWVYHVFWEHLSFYCIKEFERW